MFQSLIVTAISHNGEDTGRINEDKAHWHLCHTEFVYNMASLL